MSDSDTRSASTRNLEDLFGIGEPATRTPPSQILNIPDEADTPETSERCYGLYRTPHGGEGVEFFEANGDVTALPYMHILSIQTRRDSALVIHTSAGVLIEISGANLGELRTRLLRRRVAFVRAGGKATAETVHIERVQVTLAG